MNLRDHLRRSIRLAGYDYSFPGGYFITIVSYHRENLFGSITNGQIQLSPLGQIVFDEWMKSAFMRENLEVLEDEIMIMPNHLHGIIWINDIDTKTVKPSITTPTGIPKSFVNIYSLKRDPNTLGSIIAGFKSKVSSRAMNEVGISHIWQRNYYEHIIRNNNELNSILEYIRNNPGKWEDDQLFAR